MRGIAARCAEEAARQSVRMESSIMTIDADREGIVLPDKDVDFVVVPQVDGSSEPAVIPGNVGRFVVLVR